MRSARRRHLHQFIASLGLISLAGVGSTASAQDRAAPAPQRAQTPSQATTPSIDKFMKIRAPNSPTLAPDGTLFVRDWPDGINQVYVRGEGLNTSAPLKKLTTFADGANGYSLSPDGRHIVVAAAVGGNEQDNLYHLDPVSGELKPLLINPEVVYSLQHWLDDSSGFFYTANDESSADFHIYRYDLDTGEKKKLLGKPGYWSLSDATKDGARVLVGQYISASHANAYELDTASGNLTKLDIGPDETFNAPAGYMPGEKSTIVLSDAEDGIRRAFVRDLATGKYRKPMADLDAYEIEEGALNEERTLAAVTYNEGGYGSLRVVKLPSFEAVEMPAIERGIVGGLDLRGDTLTYSLSNARTPGLSYAWKVGESSPAQLTVADTQGIDLSRFTLPDLITYKSFDGRDIPAFIFTPPTYKKGASIPFVAIFHGGPEGQHRPGFGALNQYLLANGYGIILPNVRGSTGYGREFHMLDNYKQRWDSVRDGVEAARWLVKSGYTQPGMIATYGGSYGGFMSVAAVIEDPDVFGAGVDVVGIVNFQTFLEQTKDYRRKLREAEYGPLDDPEFLKTISSIHRIDEIKVPMLIAHGLNDPRVPVGEAMQLAVGLQKRGYDPELLFFPDEGHGFAKLENRLLFAERMVKFLDETIAAKKN